MTLTLTCDHWNAAYDHQVAKVISTVISMKGENVIGGNPDVELSTKNDQVYKTK